MNTGKRRVIAKRLAAAGLCLLMLAAFTGCGFVNSNEVESYSMEFGGQMESAMNALGEAVNSAIDGARENGGSGWPETQTSTEATVSSGWADPLPGGSVTQYFGVDNGDEGGCHLGLDLSSSDGNAAVCAIYGGTVIESDVKGSNGEIVVIEHTMDGYTFCSAYCHLQSGSRSVNIGDWVYAGEQIAAMGGTGNVTGPHLHLAIYSGRASRDPYGYLATGYDGCGYIDYTDQRGTLRFYDPEAVLDDGGRTIINNYYGS